MKASIIGTVHAALDLAAEQARAVGGADTSDRMVRFFLRDDDGGWEDARLLALLDCTRDAQVPLDLALIPQCTGEALAATLRERLQAAPAMLGVHQHGWAHVNHESSGRKCEFGPARSFEQQCSDLRAGRAQLQQAFGSALDPFFTPPWNRCSELTPALLAGLGFAALSRDRGAPVQLFLPELSVDLDWSRQRRLAVAGGEEPAQRCARELARSIVQHGGRAPIGVMLHHADMDAGDLDALRTLLRAVQSHPGARWQPMRALLGAGAGAFAAALAGAPAGANVHRHAWAHPPAQVQAQACAPLRH